MVAVEPPVVAVDDEPSVAEPVAVVDDEPPEVAAVAVSPVELVAVDPPELVPETPVAELGSVVEVDPEAGVVPAPADGMNSAKIVVVVVDCEFVVVGSGAPEPNANCTLLSSDQSTEPLPLPSTLAKLDAA